MNTALGGAAPGGAPPRADVSSPARQRAQRRDTLAAAAVVAAAGFSIVLIGLVVTFLVIRATPVFTDPAIGITQFFTSSDWQPDANVGGGFGDVMSTFGALSPIFGSLAVVGLALVIAIPLSLALALVISETNPVAGNRYVRPAIELFLGIPSVVYGYLGFTALLPILKHLAPPGADGSGILAAGIVLSIMVTPTITSLSADGILAVPPSLREASYALGATQWQTMARVLLPSARANIISGIVLGLARAMGEALAVALVIGDVNVLDIKAHGVRSLLEPFTTMTVSITDGVNNIAINPQGAAARYMLAIVLLLITFLCIMAVRLATRKSARLSG